MDELLGLGMVAGEGFLHHRVGGLFLPRFPEVKDTWLLSGLKATREHIQCQEVYHSTYMTARLEVEFMHSKMPKLLM